MTNLIEKLKKADLRGRGGASFPTGLKWEAVKKAPGKIKYVIANASEGEPGVCKDSFILENYLSTVIEGIKLAMETVGATKGFIYLRHDYYKEFKNKLIKLIGSAPISLKKKTGGYLGGEETTLLEAMEGKRKEPRLRPPYPTEKGLWNCPTLINNVETLYYAAKISQDEYQGTRFYSLNGEIKNPGVYEMALNLTIGQILQRTKNVPRFKYFVQAGGNASGNILLPEELEEPPQWFGSITVYSLKKTDPVKLIKKCLDFFYQENCGKCVPCREGVYRLKELLKQKPLNYLLIREVLSVLKETSFCALGKSVFTPFESSLLKIWK